jgi:hypothetical protein
MKREEQQKNAQIVDAMNQFKTGDNGIPVALFLGNLENNPQKEDLQKKVQLEKENDGLDNEALKKIEDFKQKYKEMQDKAADNEKELAYSTIKVDEIVGKIKEVDEKKNEFKGQLHDETKEN